MGQCDTVGHLQVHLLLYFYLSRSIVFESTCWPLKSKRKQWGSHTKPSVLGTMTYCQSFILSCWYNLHSYFSQLQIQLIQMSSEQSSRPCVPPCRPPWAFPWLSWLSPWRRSRRGASTVWSTVGAWREAAGRCGTRRDQTGADQTAWAHVVLWRKNVFFTVSLGSNTCYIF